MIARTACAAAIREALVHFCWPKHLKHHTKQMLLVRSKGGGTCASKRAYPRSCTFLASISSFQRWLKASAAARRKTGTADPDDKASQLISVSIARISTSRPGLRPKSATPTGAKYRQAARVCQHFIRENKVTRALPPSTSYETAIQAHRVERDPFVCQDPGAFQLLPEVGADVEIIGQATSVRRLSVKVCWFDYGHGLAE